MALIDTLKIVACTLVLVFLIVLVIWGIDSIFLSNKLDIAIYRRYSNRYKELREEECKKLFFERLFGSNPFPAVPPSALPIPSKPDDQITAQPDAQLVGQPIGESEGHHGTDPLTGQPAGQHTGHLAGQPDGHIAGQPDGQPDGHIAGYIAGQPDGQPTNNPDEIHAEHWASVRWDKRRAYGR